MICFRCFFCYPNNTFIFSLLESESEPHRSECTSGKVIWYEDSFLHRCNTRKPENTSPLFLIETFYFKKNINNPRAFIWVDSPSTTLAQISLHTRSTLWIYIFCRRDNRTRRKSQHPSATISTLLSPYRSPLRHRAPPQLPLITLQGKQYSNPPHFATSIASGGIFRSVWWLVKRS